MSAAASMRNAGAFFEVYAGQQQYLVKEGATCAQLQVDARLALDGALGVLGVLELHRDADFATLHLARQASGLTIAAGALLDGGATVLAVPCDFFDSAAGYQASAGTTLCQLLQDAHALASSAHGVWAELAPTTDAHFAVLHLLAQGKGMLSWAAALAEESARATALPSCHEVAGQVQDLARVLGQTKGLPAQGLADALGVTVPPAVQQFWQRAERVAKTTAKRRTKHQK